MDLTLVFSVKRLMGFRGSAGTGLVCSRAGGERNLLLLYLPLVNLLRSSELDWVPFWIPHIISLMILRCSQRLNLSAMLRRSRNRYRHRIHWKSRRRSPPDYRRWD